MLHRHIQKTFNDVAALVSRYVRSSNHNEQSLLTHLQQVHDQAEHDPKYLELELLREEKHDLAEIIKYLEKHPHLTASELDLLEKVKASLDEVDHKLEYTVGKQRVKSNNDLKYNFDYLRDLSSDSIYQTSLDFAEDRVKDLFKHKNGTMPGTIAFCDALDTLYSFCMYALLDENVKEADRKIIPAIIMDIACSINIKACKYLIHKDQMFADFNGHVNAH